MSGCRQQYWLTYASTGNEAWKALVLARSLRRVVTTRPIGVILSEAIPLEMGRKLQDEFNLCHWAQPDPKVPFHSLAKDICSKRVSKEIHKFVFLDCNLIALKNPDELFHQHGVQFCEEVAVIVTKSRSLSPEDHDLFMEAIIKRENKETGDHDHYPLQELNYCLGVDLKGRDPSPLPGSDLKIVFFTNGHPNDIDFEKGWNKNGILEEELVKLGVSLAPELHPPKIVKEFARPEDIPWELHNSVAIVGMACRYPGANSMEEFWTLLDQGLEGIRKVPEGRWTKDKAFIRMDNMRNTDAGFLSCPVDTFDAKFWNTNAADMHYLDPQQRLSLRIVWEALEHAGIDPNSLRNSLTGVFGGWWRNDYKEMLQMLGIVDQDFLRGYMGNALGPLTARIAHFFDFIGPAFSTESGCSTSVAGVDMACDSLRSEACDLAIAVGANLLLHPFSPSIMEGVLAPDGRCKTFDASADGFGRAEGIGVLVLKRFSNAVADGDRIWGLIRGSAIVQEGTSKSMGTPTVDVEARAMTLALERSGVNPDDVEFVETHGTGTPVGDPIEVNAIAKAYGSTKRKEPLVIGSVKTNIGHTESVCGIAGIQKAVLSMRHQVIPKHLHLKKLNPEIDLHAIPAKLPLDPLPWKRRMASDKPRIAGVNSFGITGAQAHVIVQEPPESHQLPPHALPFTDKRSLRLLTFSAKTDEALRAQITAYENLLKNTELELNDIEYSMHTGRPHLQLRRTVMGSTKEELVTKLEPNIKGKAIPNTVPKLCFLFTGQGSQYPGMAKSLYEENIVFKSNFDWMDSILMNDYSINMKEALWDNAKSEKLLKTSLYSQTAIFCVEFCLLRLWESWGLKPDAVMGHSLGEFAAAVAAGILTAEDAIKLVVTRSKLINALPTGSMIVVGGDLDKALSLMDRAFANEKKWLDIAAVNSPSQTVLAGPTEIVKEFKVFCDNNEVKTHVLDASHAFHSRMMDPMLKEYEEVAMKVKKPQKSGGVTFISGVDGRVVEGQDVDAKYWLRHTRERVRFIEASHTGVKEGLSLFLEVGPHPVLSALVMTNVDDIADVEATPSLRKKANDWETMLGSVAKLHSAGISINWKNFHRFSGGKKVDLPGYYFEESPYWMSIKDDGTIPFHPLVGAYVPNPSDSTIFKSSVNVQRLPFLKDHALGDKIIFPCVGYVDMCLTAGYTAQLCSQGQYLKPTTPLSVKNFSIVTPVCLSEMQPTEFQVVVNKSPEGETCSTIYTRLFLEDGKFKWVKNATATFSPSPAPLPADLDLDLAGIKSRCTESVRSDFDYKMLEEFGFNFGPSCRSLSSAGWRNGDINPQDGAEWLFPFKTLGIQDEDYDRFLIHPWCVDPMLQTHIMTLGVITDKQVRKRLVVPVSIENYTWWGHAAPSGFIYIKHSSSGNEAYLLDEEGKLMVSMIGTEFMETTISNILSLIDSQRNPFPSMAEYAWKEKLGPEERRVPDEERGTIPLQELANDHSFNDFSFEESEFYRSFNTLAELYMIKTIKELGLDSSKAFSWPKICNDLNVVPFLHKLLRYILLELTRDGWFSLQDGTENDETLVFKLEQALPELTSVHRQIDSFVKSIRSKEVGKVDLECVEGVWPSLAQILTGKQSALPLLFPEGTNVKGPAELYYTESLFATKRYAMNNAEAEVLTKLSQMGSRSVVRVLEVGAGIGSATTHLIRNMTEAGVTHFEYTFTDLSPSFLQKGQQLFDDTGISAKFAILNVENDPLSQGTTPGYYDVIVASWVLHATKNVTESISNLKKLLKPGGYLLITELTNPTRAVKLLFGGLEGFWRFDDQDIRPWNCELGLSEWKTVLEREGFTDFAALESYNSTNALIFVKLKEEASIYNIKSGNKEKESDNKDRWIVFGDKDKETTKELLGKLEATNSDAILFKREDLDRKNSNSEKIREFLSKNSTALKGLIYLWGLDPSLRMEEVCEPFFHICQFLCNNRNLNIRVVLYTKGNISTGPTDFFQSEPHFSPLIGMLNVLANENPDLLCKCVDLDPSPSLKEDLRISEGFTELFSSDQEVMVAYRNRQRCLPRLRPYKVKSSPLPIPKSPRFRLVLPQSRLISDLTFAPCESEPIPEGHVEVEVKAYALNFLDVFMVTKPDPVFDKYNYLGIDMAGFVSQVGPKSIRKVGDRVVLIRRKGVAMPSHVVGPDNRTLLIPDDITFHEACTYPMAMLTTGSCLVDSAKAKKGDIVLIHTASGGVGLIAIQIAQRLGCEVVVTAGNERKRNYLRRLGLKYVFNSRTTEYEKDIREALGGRGVTVVLNSLTGPGFKEATLNVCENGARFVEMSKMNIWSREEVKQLRPDIFYDIVDVSTLTEEKITELSEFIQAELLASYDRRPKPLPYTVFDASEIRDALEHMEKVKHIGKIVLTMPEQKSGEWVFPMFNETSSYMITGGLGGIGLEVAKWMASQGANTLILIGRSKPKPEALEKIDVLRKSGVRIEVRQCDVGNMSDLRNVMEETGPTSKIGLPPLRGVMHAAGVLADATYENQSWEKYETVFHCKVKGAWNLHRLSIEMSQFYPWEHFVVFSSLTSTLGAVAQSNYAASNQFLDALVHYRNSWGMPGTGINYGQWGEVGLAANLVVAMNKPLTILQGIAALEHALKSHKIQVHAHEADLAGLKQLLPSIKGLLADIEEDSSSGQTEIDGDEFWREYDACDGHEERYDVLRKFLKRLIRLTLKMDKNEEIDDHVNFQDMGMDSLMMVEMKNGLQASVGKRVKISINAVKDCKTVAQLGDRLVELISGKEDLPVPTKDELLSLARKDAILPDFVKVDAALKTTLVPLSKVSVIFLTGATGTLGPYVLREILQRKNVKKVYCLLQSNPLVSPEERFKRIIEKKGLLSEMDLKRVKCVAGDVKAKNFGLTDSAYDKLVSECDAVFNMAVKVAFEEVYRESDDPKSSRITNVWGMKNVLQFACEKKLKYIYHTSTFAAETQVGDDGLFWESWPKEEEISLFPNSAYSISKLICDRLAEQAVERGVPCKVFRLPQIGGDSMKGGNIQLESFLMMRFLAYLYIGMMPDARIHLSLMPVDLCAKLSVKLFFNEKAGFEVFNVLNPHLGDERDFKRMAEKEFGVKVEGVNPDEFLQKWNDMDSKDEMIQMVKFATSQHLELLHLRDHELPYYTSWREGNSRVFFSKKLEKLIPECYPKIIPSSWDVLKKDLIYMRDSGVFDRFRIKHSLSK